MADIRINSLPSTATSFNTDDYIAIDGASAGTRRMLAANPPFSDVTLGTSGPSVKSTLSARAPRQGLVLNGTAGSTVSGPTLGTSNFTAAAWVNISSLPASAISGVISGATNSLSFGIGTTGAIDISKTAVANVGTSTGTITAGKQSLIVYSRSGTTGTFYINGVASGTVTDSQDYSVAQTLVGSAVTSSLYVFPGVIVPSIYNRALSASEVVALYESGVPAGSDYNTASNTSLITGDNSTFASDTGYWTKVGGTTIGSGVATIPTLGTLGKTSLLTAGKKYRLTFTATLSSTTLTVNNGLVTYATAAAGANSFEFTAATNGTLNFTSVGGTATVDDVLLYPLGLLLAPDAGQAGGGLTWYDTSGNAANITLPATGVSWNVPSSRYLGGNWTTSGNLTVSGGTITGGTSGMSLASGGTNQNLSITPSGTGRVHIAKSAGQDSYIELAGNGNTAGTSSVVIGQSGADLGVLYNRKNAALSFGTNGTEVARFFANGNLFVGASPVDGGQKLQVSGTGYISSTLTTGGNFQVGAAQADIGAFLVETIDGSDNIRIGARRTGTNKPANLQLVTSSASNTYNVALTLDSSQNATFAGTVTASTAGNYVLQLKDTRSQAADVGASIGLQGTYTGSLQTTFGSILGLKVNSTDGNFAGKLVFQTRPNGGSLTTALTLDDSQNATFAGSTGVQLKNDSFLYFGSTVRTAVKGNSTGSLELYANNNLSLTLDTSGNATFAKSITASGPLTLSSSTQGNANFYAISTSASANFGALYEADARTQSANARWNWGTGSTDGGAAADSFRIRERVTGVNTLVISAVTGNATFAGSLTTSAPTGGAGAWELGVYSATAPTATGYVTIEIGGVQYKLLAST